METERNAYYRTTLHILMNYLCDASHDADERQLFLAVIVRLLQYEGFSIIECIDTWEEFALPHTKAQKAAIQTVFSESKTEPLHH